MALSQIYVGRTPERDHNVEANDQALKNLPHPFEGEFWGGTQGHDGLIRWKTPIHCVVDHGPTKTRAFGIVGENARIGAELEVGYVPAYKTLLGISFANVGVGCAHYARWPYGHDRITIFHSLYHNGIEDDFETLCERAFDTTETCLNPWAWWENTTEKVA